MDLMKIKPEKIIFYGGLAVGGFLLLSIWNKGIGGTAKDLTKGIITGVVDGAAGVIQGAYEAIPDSVRPDSDQNIMYKGVNKIGAELTGDPGFSLGGWIYDKTH